MNAKAERVVHKKNIASRLIGLLVLTISNLIVGKQERYHVTGTTHTTTGSYPLQF